ncbi:TPA: GGDEF domain-containing protein [Citrobacter gillenii]
MNTSKEQIHKKNLLVISAFSVTVLLLFLFISPSTKHYSLSVYPVIATFAGALHIQIGCFMTMNYISNRKKTFLVPLACAFHCSGILLFIALCLFFYGKAPSGVIYNDIAVLYFLRNTLIAGLFFVTYYLYAKRNKEQKLCNAAIHFTFAWCAIHLVTALLYSTRILPHTFLLVNPNSNAWLRPLSGLASYSFILMWASIVLLGAIFTRLKNLFWLSMSLVALSNLVSIAIMLKYAYMDSAGWYIARGLECLSAMAVMIALMSDIFQRYKTSRQAYELSYQNSVRDPMTRIYNRGYFYSSLSAEIKKANDNRPLSIIFCDIDFFKSVNDTWGHLQGDRVIIKLAEIIQQQSRCHDVIARIGGEEFAILLPETSADTAYNIAERIRIIIEQQTPDTTNGDFPRTITISLGIVSSADNHAAAEQLADLADRALYKAKNQGRNCVVIHSDASANLITTPALTITDI